MTVLIIGLGSIANKHISVLKQLYNDLTIYAWRSAPQPDDDKGVTNIYDLGELQQTPDFVIIANPTHLHLTALKNCIPLRVPVMIEKPLTDGPGYKAIDNYIREIESNHILTYVACNLRFHEAITFLKAHLPGKRINEVNVYCGSWLPGWRQGKDFRTFYSVDPGAGGGVHLDLIHELDYCYWLFGKPEKVAGAKTNNSSLSIRAADYATYNLSYKEFSVNVTLNYYRVDAKRQIEILFEDSTWTVDLLTCCIRDHKGNTIFIKEDYNVMDTYREQMKYFVSHIQSGQPLMNSAKESCEILKWCLGNE